MSLILEETVTPKLISLVVNLFRWLFSDLLDGNLECERLHLRNRSLKSIFATKEYWS